MNKSEFRVWLDDIFWLSIILFLFNKGCDLVHIDTAGNVLIALAICVILMYRVMSTFMYYDYYLNRGESKR